MLLTAGLATSGFAFTYYMLERETVDAQLPFSHLVGSSFCTHGDELLAIPNAILSLLQISQTIELVEAGDSCGLRRLDLRSFYFQLPTQSTVDEFVASTFDEFELMSSYFGGSSCWV